MYTRMFYRKHARSIRLSWEQLRYFCIFRETEIIQVRCRKWRSRASGETLLNRDRFRAKSFDNGKDRGIIEWRSREFEKLGRHYGEDTALVSGRYLSCLNILRERDRFFSESRISIPWKNTRNRNSQRFFTLSEKNQEILWNFIEIREIKEKIGFFIISNR